MATINRIEAVTLDFGKRFSENAPKTPIHCQDKLRSLIVSAAIGSGVRYEIAEKIVNALPVSPTDEELRDVSKMHRFPNQTYKRLSIIFASNSSLLQEAIELLIEPTCIEEARQKMSWLIPGVGAKQASFIFSCAGYGQNIAVLDRHILRYLKIVGVAANDNFPSSWKNYRLLEKTFLDYSNQKNLRADALDIAIWITMKAAGKRGVECAQ